MAPMTSKLIKADEWLAPRLSECMFGFKIISVVDVIYVFPMRLHGVARHSIKMMTFMLPINEGTRSKIKSQYKKVLFSFDE